MRFIALIIVQIIILLTISSKTSAEDTTTTKEDQYYRTESAILSNFHVPGTTQTISGYDTELGEDAICWVSYGRYGNGTEAFISELLPQFTLNENGVQILQSCPIGNTLFSSFKDDSTIELPYRTGTYYNYTVDVNINITSLNGTNIVSDDKLPLSYAYGDGSNTGTTITTSTSTSSPAVAIQVVLCELGKAGFCTPFVHEATNARLNQSDIIPEGDRHGDSHIHSGYKYVPISSMEQSNDDIIHFEMTVPIIVNRPGHFFAIAAVHFFLEGDNIELSTSTENNISTSTNTVFIRYDMANSIAHDDKLISFQAPGTILTVPRWVSALSYLVIAFVAAVILFLLIQTIIHRNNRIIGLCQGPFLIVFLFAALVATVATFLFNPLNDTYCRINMPIMMTSLQLLYSVTAGRLWRINAVISPLLVKTLHQEQRLSQKIYTFVRNICHKFNNSTTDDSAQQPRKLRKQVTTGRLACIVTALTLPQVILQVLHFTIQPSQLDIIWNEERSRGRATCNCGPVISHTIAFYGYLYFFFTIIGLLIVAEATQSLPCLFNETRVIFETTMTTLVVLLLGVGIIAATNDAYTSPAVHYIVLVVLCLSITLQTSYRIMMPKLRMIWNGETVIVSQLILDHKACVAQKNQSFKTPRERFLLMFGLSNDFKKEQQDATERITTTTTTSRSAVRSDSKDTNRGAEVDNAGITTRTMNSQVAADDRAISPSLCAVEDTVEEQRDTLSELKRTAVFPLPQSSCGDAENYDNRISIDTKRTPDGQILLQMLQLQEKVTSLSSRIMSGRAATEEDWTLLRETTRNLHTTFSDEVMFTWEENNHSKDNNNAKKDAELTTCEKHQNDIEARMMEKTENITSSGNGENDDNFHDEIFDESSRQYTSIEFCNDN